MTFKTQVYKKDLDNIKQKFDRLERTISQQRKEIAEFNADTKIQKLKEKLEDLYKHSLLELSDKELQAKDDFKRIHYKTCNNGNDFIYRIIGTGIGNGIRIKCAKCGIEKDITDTESW